MQRIEGFVFGGVLIVQCDDQIEELAQTIGDLIDLLRLRFERALQSFDFYFGARAIGGNSSHGGRLGSGIAHGVAFFQDLLDDIGGRRGTFDHAAKSKTGFGFLRHRGETQFARTSFRVSRDQAPRSGVS